MVQIIGSRAGEVVFLSQPSEPSSKNQSGQVQESGAPYSGGPALLLDKDGRESTRPVWSRRQYSCYQALRSIDRLREVDGWQALRVDFTSPASSEPEILTDHFEELRRRIARRWGYRNMCHFFVRTSEGPGAGVLHGFLYWRPAAGERWRSFSIPWAWLSQEWEKIHGAWNVSVKRFPYRGEGGRAACLRYIVNQYVAGQSGYVRYFYSWRRLAGFPIKRLWGMFTDKCNLRGSACLPGGLLFGRGLEEANALRAKLRKLRLALWHAFIDGERVGFADGSTFARGDVSAWNAIRSVGRVDRVLPHVQKTFGEMCDGGGGFWRSHYSPNAKRRAQRGGDTR